MQGRELVHDVPFEPILARVPDSVSISTSASASNNNSNNARALPPLLRSPDTLRQITKGSTLSTQQQHIWPQSAMRPSPSDQLSAFQLSAFRATTKAVLWRQRPATHTHGGVQVSACRVLACLSTPPPPQAGDQEDASGQDESSGGVTYEDCMAGWLESGQQWSAVYHKGFGSFGLDEVKRAMAVVVGICDRICVPTRVVACAAMTVGVVFADKEYMRSKGAEFWGARYARGSIGDKGMFLLTAACVLATMKQKLAVFDEAHKAMFDFAVAGLMQETLDCGDGHLEELQYLEDLQVEVQKVSFAGAQWAGPVEFVERFAAFDSGIFPSSLPEAARELITQRANRVIRAAVLEGLFGCLTASKMACIALQDACGVVLDFLLSTSEYRGGHPLASLALLADQLEFAGQIGADVVGAGARAEVWGFSLRVPALHAEVDEFTGGRGLVLKKLREVRRAEI